MGYDHFMKMYLYVYSYYIQKTRSLIEGFFKLSSLFLFEILLS